MSMTLEEVIQDLELILDDSEGFVGCDNCGEDIPPQFLPLKSDVQDILMALRELNKPVQYTVEIRASLEFGGDMKDAFINSDRIVSWYDMFVLENQSLAHINRLHDALGLPPITFEQITFVEV